MRYSISFRQEDYDELVSTLFRTGCERAAYLLCGRSIGSEETKLLVREVVPIEDADVRSASKVHLAISAAVYSRWLKRADDTKLSLVFVHTHPAGSPDYSSQDDREETAFFATAHTRVPGGTHASIVLSDPEHPRGRVWLEDGSVQPFECIRILGRCYRFIRNHASCDSHVTFYDRQIRAFGREFQPILRGMHIAVVGLGGTGSNVCEQLIRLGVGNLTISDGDTFDSTNVNRVYGSYATDEGLHKVSIANRLANSIGVGTRIIAVPRPILYRSAFEYLKDCDLVFGCTDDQVGRSLINSLALYYLIPVIDMGVQLVSDGTTVDRVEGRVTTLFPGAACLYCRGRITPDGIRDETIRRTDPRQAERLRHEGYLAGVEDRAPSVIPFTTAIAASAVIEFLDRLTGFMGADRTATEVINRISWSRVRTNSVPSRPGCLCADRTIWGRGDTRPLLDLVWPEEA